MYSLDINFLKDRGLVPTEKTNSTITNSPQPITSKIPLIAGATAAILLPLITFMQIKSIEKRQQKHNNKSRISMEKLPKLVIKNSKFKMQKLKLTR